MGDLLSLAIVSPTNIANGDFPFCDEGGCSFKSNSFLYATLPTGYGGTWTVGMWLRGWFVTDAVPFSIVQVRKN